jgi:uncharacterized oxidoreductase
MTLGGRTGFSDKTMKVSGNSVLITGGATGIGLALAEKFVNMDNEVVICGRREDKLEEAKKKLPNIRARRCDVSREEDRKSLRDWVVSDFTGMNILVNNAGIQRRIDLTKGTSDISKSEDEIDINFKAQVYLSALFIPILSKQKEAAIVNVSSGLGFVPLAMFPIYCATKAAIHSFSLSLRQQLRDTSVKLFEVIPPTVYDTELKGKPIEKSEWSISSAEMADAVLNGLKKDEYEIASGGSKSWISASRGDLDQAFKRINQF